MILRTDLFRRTDVWLVDIGLEASLEEGAMMATRLYTPSSFRWQPASTCHSTWPHSRGVRLVLGIQIAITSPSAVLNSTTYVPSLFGPYYSRAAPRARG
jgi:hypothetical protein